MTNPAAAIEAATAAQAVAAFANCSATVGGVSKDGIFDDAYLDPLGIAGSQPALVCVSADVSTAAQGTAVVVNSVSYTVGSKADNPEDLGTGMTRLLLQEAG